ncbi:MAG: hypothetical protein K6C10_07735 [Prevotella sp.]|nr:hypothetical protein [Prevotella sp.]
MVETSSKHVAKIVLFAQFATIYAPVFSIINEDLCFVSENAGRKMEQSSSPELPFSPSIYAKFRKNLNVKDN